MVLFIDACVRKESRTRELAEFLLEHLDQPIEKIYLPEADVPELTREALARRTDACCRGDYSLSEFEYAKQFASADTVVIAAPHWDLSFPAILKRYIEAICVTGITFRYSETGAPVGLCKAKDLYFVTSSGGAIFNPAFGYGYIETLAKGMFGIKNTAMFSAENLDIDGNDEQQIINSSKQAIEEWFRENHPGMSI